MTILKKDHRYVVPAKEQTIGRKLKEHPDGFLSQHTCVHEIDKSEGGLPKSSMVYRNSLFNHWNIAGLNQRPREMKNPTMVWCQKARCATAAMLDSSAIWQNWSNGLQMA